jgi:hypothetical protein
VARYDRRRPSPSAGRVRPVPPSTTVSHRSFGQVWDAEIAWQPAEATAGYLRPRLRPSPFPGEHVPIDDPLTGQTVCLSAGGGSRAGRAALGLRSRRLARVGVPPRRAQPHPRRMGALHARRRALPDHMSSVAGGPVTCSRVTQPTQSRTARTSASDGVPERARASSRSHCPIPPGPRDGVGLRLLSSEPVRGGTVGSERPLPGSAASRPSVSGRDCVALTVAHLRHTYALVGAVGRATPSTTPNRLTGRPSPVVARRTRSSPVNRPRLWP